jgi:flagellar P-ring protein precursor FlgI
LAFLKEHALKHANLRIICAIVGFIVVLPTAGRTARLKEISAIQGFRENPLIGYGLVVGLQGTGDKSNTQFTVNSLTNMLQRLGVQVSPNAVKVKNVAAVMATAKLTPFVRPGQNLDVTVSSLGDAKSLHGGQLILTSLKGPDGRVYAVAQGPVSVGGFVFGGASGGSAQSNHPTVGRIPNGAVVERALEISINGQTRFRFVLNRPDFTTARRAVRAINETWERETARCVDGGTLEVSVPAAFRSRVGEFLAVTETIDVKLDTIGKIVLDERTGTVIMGERVTIDPVAIAQGGLTVVIKETPEVSQPEPFAPEPRRGARPVTDEETGVTMAPGGQTVVVPRTDLQVEETSQDVVLLQGGTTIGDLVRALNAIGMTPRQLIRILQAIHRAGALHAHLEII